MESNKYNYRAFSLNIISDFVLHPLIKTKPFKETEADVEIIKGKVESLDETNNTQDKNGFLFMIPDYAKGYVANGKRIVIEPVHGVTDSQIAQIILITAFYKLLVQRGYLTLHGSSLMIDGRCVIFAGESGSGKTSLSLAFMQKGYLLLSDDIAAVSIDDKGTAFVRPSYPQQRIKRQTAQANCIDISNLNKIDFEEEKYFLPVDGSFYDTMAPVAAIFELRDEECESVSMTRICGKSKLPVLINHTHGLRNIMFMGMGMMHFQRCTEVARITPLYRIIRPHKGLTTDRQMDLVLSALQD